MQYCLKLQNIMYCIRNKKNNIVNNHRTSSSRKKSNIFYVLKFLLKPQMTSQNVALWNINIALWVTFLFIVTKIFHLWKMTYLTFNWQNAVMSWTFYAVFGKIIRFDNSISIFIMEIALCGTDPFNPPPHTHLYSRKGVWGGKVKIISIMCVIVDCKSN